MAKFFYGDDRYFLNQHLQVNYVGFDFTDDYGTAKRMAGMTSLFSKGVLYTLPKFTASLVNQLEVLSQYRNLVVVYHGIPDLRTKAFKLLKNRFGAQGFILPKDWDSRRLIPKIDAIAESLNLVLERDVAQQLVKLYGNDFYRVHNTLLTLHSFTGGTITLSSLSELTAGQTVIFELVDYLVHQDLPSALACFHQLENEPVYKVLSILSSQLSKYRQVKLGLRLMPPWQYKKAASIVSSVSLGRLLDISHNVANAQKAVVTGAAFHLQSFIISQCQR